MLDWIWDWRVFLYLWVLTPEAMPQQTKIDRSDPERVRHQGKPDLSDRRLAERRKGLGHAGRTRTRSGAGGALGDLICLSAMVR